MKGLVIWAHSKCRSTFALYREVVRQAPCPVRIVLWKGELACRIAQGFTADEFADMPTETIGDDWTKAQCVLDETIGWVQVVCAYEVAKVNRRVIRVAHGRGDRVVVYSEAPCEMCVGPKAWFKRLYCRFALPLKMKGIVSCADLILSQSGKMGTDRLLRLGWRREQIVPFGYASPRLPLVESNASPVGAFRRNAPSGDVGLTILHLGGEAPYRGVSVLDRAVALVRARGVKVALRKTGGTLPLPELLSAIRGADLVVGCGLCEPWGLRINDAVMERKPVVVSDGMGVSWLVESTGCGLVVPKGDARALARALERCATDRDCLRHLAAGAEAASRTWSPAARAKEFLARVLDSQTEACA